jgi:hypothetical protein
LTTCNRSILLRDAWRTGNRNADISTGIKALAKEAVAVNLLFANSATALLVTVNQTFLRCYIRFEIAAKVSDDDVSN